jgi:hypothetical protein
MQRSHKEDMMIAKELRESQNGFPELAFSVKPKV